MNASMFIFLCYSKTSEVTVLYVEWTSSMTMAHMSTIAHYS